MPFNASVKATGRILGRAGKQVLSQNIEAYENTVPAMLSDRLRNPKFSGPENPQTGIAAEWEPNNNTMIGLTCRLLPGMYMSGREAQLLHNYTESYTNGILQAGVPVRQGETFEVEIWARAQRRPVQATVELRLPGMRSADNCSGHLSFDHGHWHRRTCSIKSPGTGSAYFTISIPGDSTLVIDQVHLRPAGEGHVSRALLDAFGKFPCPVLRFPGGCATCTYHWEHGTGPVELRPVCDDPVFKYKMQYDFGTDEYLELCAANNIRPLITLNTTTATPRDAAAWAAYVRNWYLSRKIPVPAAYFMFGNENYGVWEIGHMTGEMYAAQLREFVPPVRRAYPEARMLAIGEFESGGIRESQKTPWRSVVIEKAADLFDTLVVTRYSGAHHNMPLTESMKCVANDVAAKEADLQVQAESIRAAGLNRTIGIVEWNYWTQASHNDHAGFYEPNDIRHCLYAAGYINAFCRQGEMLETANFYSLVNTMGMIHVRNGEAAFSDLAKVFSLYEPALPGDVMELEFEAPALTENSRMINACFIRKDSSVFGFLVNFSPDTEAEVSLAGLGTVTEAKGITAEAILTPVTAIAPKTGGTSVLMPPMSFVRVKASQS